MQNTCHNCKWAYIAWLRPTSEKIAQHQLRCHPDGDETRDQLAEIPCLKWQLDDGGEL